MSYSEDFVDLREPRDFGEMLSATFAVIRMEFMPLGKALLMIVGPFIVLSIVVGAMASVAAAGAATQFVFADPNNPMDVFMSEAGLLGVGSGLIMLTAIAAIAINFSVNWVGYEYVRLYFERGEGNIPVSDILAAIGEDWLSLLVASIVSFIVLMIGAIFCIVPVFYLLVPMSFLVVSRVMQPNDSLSEAFSDAFALTKDRWGSTFGVILVASLIVGGIGWVFAIPEELYTAGLLGADGEPYNLVTGVLLLALKNVPTFLAIIPAVAAAVAYIAAREYHMADTLYDEVENMETPDASYSADDTEAYGDDAQNDGAAAHDAGDAEDSETPESASDGGTRWQKPDDPSSSDDDSSDDDNASDDAADADKKTDG